MVIKIHWVFSVWFGRLQFTQIAVNWEKAQWVSGTSSWLPTEEFRAPIKESGDSKTVRSRKFRVLAISSIRCLLNRKQCIWRHIRAREICDHPIEVRKNRLNALSKMETKTKTKKHSGDEAVEKSVDNFYILKSVTESCMKKFWQRFMALMFRYRRIFLINFCAIKKSYLFLQFLYVNG